MILPKDDSGFSNTLIFIVVAIIIGSLAFWYFLRMQTNYTSPILPRLSVGPTPTPSPFKTYTNEKYGFTITYPRMGVVAHENDMSKGECGGAIKEDAKDATLITVDNFMTIQVQAFPGPVQDYLKSAGAANIYETTNIATASASEDALLIGDLKKGVEYARGFPPLVYTKAIYKKGDKLFIMKATQFPNNFGGCVLPEMVDPIKFPDIAKQKWDITQSLKFK